MCASAARVKKPCHSEAEGRRIFPYTAWRVNGERSFASLRMTGTVMLRMTGTVMLRMTGAITLRMTGTVTHVVNRGLCSG